MTYRKTLFHPFRAPLGAVLVALIAVGCSKSDKNNGPRIATSITANTASSGQTGTALGTLSQPISVNVTDQNSNALQGAVVTWSPAIGNGTVDSATSTTNSSGNATTRWTLGSAVGAQVMHASLAGGASVTINATATAALPAAAIVKVSGDAQSVASGGSVSQPLVVKVTDGSGNPVPGATVTWTANGGTLSAASTVTDGTGMAHVTLTTAASPRAYTITATTGSLTAVMFAMSGT